MMLRLTCSTLAVIAMTAPAAFSLTADQVWTTWQTYLTDSGYEVTIGSREDGGDALVLKDVVLRATPGEGATSTVTLPLIRMGQTGGADIRTEYPEGASFQFTSQTGQDGGATTLTVAGDLDLASAETISREDGGNQVDTSTAPEIVLALTEIAVDGEGLGEAPFTLTMRGVNSTTTFLGGLNILTDSRMSGLTGLIDVLNPDGSVKGKIETGETRFASETNFPAGHEGTTTAALAEALRAGAVMTGKASFASLAMDLDATENSTGVSKAMAFAMQGDTGTTEFGLADGRLGYQFDLTGVTYDLTSDDLPFPVQVALEALGSDVQFPLLASAEVQPFKLAYSLDKLTLNDAIWGQIDPQGALSHDPASLGVDVTGDLLVDQDLLTYEGPATASGMEAAPPVRPVALTLNQLALSALGAGISATGAVSFPDPDNVDIAVGTLEARLDGLNGLMDSLVKGGFVTDADVQGARMMLMMFAKPVEGQADALQAHLELKEDGSVFANGMQVK